MPAPELIQKIFLPKGSAHPASQHNWMPSLDVAPSFSTCALRIWVDVMTEHMGALGSQTITYLTASPPAPGPLLGCSDDREKGQKSDARKHPTPTVKGHDLLHPPGQRLLNLPSPPLSVPSAPPYQSFTVNRQRNQYRWRPRGRPCLPAPTRIECSVSHLPGQKGLMDWLSASVVSQRMRLLCCPLGGSK